MKNLLWLFLFILPSFLSAQEKGALRVFVILYQQPHIDNNVIVTPVASAKIKLIDPVSADTIVAFTDENGWFVFTDIPTGFYLVKVEKTGFQSSNYYPVHAYDAIEPNKQLPVCISLVPSIE